MYTVALPPLPIIQRRLKTPSIADYFPRLPKTPVEMESSKMEDAWMCDEEDESLDTTLWNLEIQGIIPGTPVNKDRALSIATKPQDITVLEDGGVQEDWEGGEEEDYWLSQTLHVQEYRGAGNVLPDSTHPHITLEEEAVGVAPMLATTGQASVSRINGAEIVGPFVGVGNVVVEGQITMDPQRCVMPSQESHSLDDGENSEEGYTRKPSSHTEPSSGGEEKRRDDDHAQPHAPIVSTHTKLQQVQRAEIRTQRSASAKYYTSSPLPRAREVTSSIEKKKKEEMVVKSGTAKNHQKEAPDDKKRSRKPSSLTSGRERCVHAKGGDL